MECSGENCIFTICFLTLDVPGTENVIDTEKRIHYIYMRIVLVPRSLATFMELAIPELY
jgi:hypothetical protein